MKTIRHTVRLGENLTIIARRYGMTWRELYEHELNSTFRERCPDPNRIKVGHVLHLPASAEAARRLGAFDTNGKR